MRQKTNENLRQYAERLADELQTPSKVRERVITDLVRKLSDSQLIRQIEGRRMKVVLSPQYGFGYSIK